MASDREVAAEKCRIARELWFGQPEPYRDAAAFQAVRDAWAWVDRARGGELPCRRFSEFLALLEGRDDRLFGDGTGGSAAGEPEAAAGGGGP